MNRILISTLALSLLVACNRQPAETSAATTPPSHATPAQDTTPGANTQSSPALLAQPDPNAVLHEGYIRAVAQMAYVWSWPMVNMINRRANVTKALQPGHLDGVLPVAPRGQIGMLADYIAPSQTFVTCPNQDVVYGLGFFSLDEEPVVIQVPDFGASGCTRSTMHGPTSSARSASRTAANRGSTCWPAPTGRAIRRPASPA